jgi:hypothetical protein
MKAVNGPVQGWRIEPDHGCAVGSCPAAPLVPRTAFSF